MEILLPSSLQSKASIIKDSFLTVLQNQGLLFLWASSRLWTLFVRLLLAQPNRLNELLLSSGLRSKDFHHLDQTAEQFRDERASHFIYLTAARTINP